MVELTQAPVRGFLASVGLTPEIIIRFQFNPTELTDKRSVSFTTLNAPGLLMPVRQYSQGGDRTLSFKVRVDGMTDGPVAIQRSDDGGIGPELNKYRAFLYPQTSQWQNAGASFAPLYSDTHQFVSPPPCRFGMGERIIDCIVTDVSITETAFTPNLTPLRADVSVTIAELIPYDPNTASGGSG